MIKLRRKIISTIKDLKEKGEIVSELSAVITKNKISYTNNDTKEQLKINEKNIVLKRENTEFIHIICFVKGKTIPTNYHLKKNNLDIEINIYTESIKVEENKISINYKVLESNNDYEFIIEMR